MAHRRAKLTPLGRRILVERVLVEGWSASAAAEAVGVSRDRLQVAPALRDPSLDGLVDRSSAPLRRPRALPRRQVKRILAGRRRLGWGPIGSDRCSGARARRSTECSAGRARPGLGETDRPTRTPIRYERDRPGEFVHVDVTKLGKIPSGGGWRKLGRSHQTRLKRNEGRGYDYLHVAVDDHSRLAHVEVLPDELGTTCASFLARAAERFAEAGIGRIERVMTDNAFGYVRSGAFRMPSPPSEPPIDPSRPTDLN